MLTVKISRADKQFFTLEDVLTVRLDADLNVPADSLTVTCPYNDTIRKTPKQSRRTTATGWCSRGG